MTTSTTPQSEPRPSTRRALLAGALGGLGALAASAIGRPSLAQAHDADDVRLGGSNSTTATTSITNTFTNGDAFAAHADAGFAISGTSNSGRGVAGESNIGDGVHGESTYGNGVSGSSQSSRGVFGISNSSSGMYGYSDLNNGVFGESAAAAASGVYGENTAKGYGRAGRSNSPGLGVDGIYAAACLGENTAGGIGVWARSQNGVGLYADAIDQTQAIALKTRGITQFSRSGTLTILAGHTSVTKSAIRIDPGALVLAVLQQDRTGIHVRSAVPNVSGDSFTIHLNKTVSGDTKVGWFIVN
jgi:hypothetical protein